MERKKKKMRGGGGTINGRIKRRKCENYRN